MSPIAVVTDEAEARRILAALGLPHQPVAVAPPRDPDEPTSRGPPRASGDADGPDGPLFAFDDSAQPFPDDDGNQVVPGDAEIRPSPRFAPTALDRSPSPCYRSSRARSPDHRRGRNRKTVGLPYPNRPGIDLVRADRGGETGRPTANDHKVCGEKSALLPHC